MGADYYYLVASLPTLRFEDQPVLDSEAFLSACEYRLDAGAYRDLAALTLDPRDPPVCAAERAWVAYEIALRNHLARARGQRLRRDPQPWLRPFLDHFAALEAQVTEALAAPHPRAAARQVDFLRWRELDQLSAQYPFSYDYLILYRLKLLLVERGRALQTAAGAERLDGFVARVVHSLQLPELAHAGN